MKQTKIVNVLNTLEGNRSRYFRLQLCIEGIIIGALTGLVISAYRGLLEGSEILRPWLYSYFTLPHWPFFVAYCALILFFSFFLYWLIKKEPLCTGSGIPQIKGILLGKMHMNWLRVLICKFIGGVIAIGAGLSLGREGPSVQLGAALAQGVSRSRKRSRMEERFLLTSGACAGLSAAFNAPLAGIIFGFEELYKNFSPLVLMGTAAASVTAAAVTDIFFGNTPVFHTGSLQVLPMNMYGFLFLLGAFVALLGICFNTSLFKAMDCFEKQTLLKKMWKPALPLFTAVILGFILPQILGGGNHLVDILIKENYGLAFLCILYIGKLLFTAMSFGSGVPGGIFLPMLVLGAIGGGIFNHFAIILNANAAFYATNFIVFGMAAYFAAVVKAPITGSILIMEMTGSFQHMLALICVSMTAYVVTDLLKGKPVYDALLNRSLRNHPKIKAHLHYKRVLLERVVGNGSSADGKLIHSIEWPAHSLIVSLKRGETEIIPDGQTRLQSGDYMYILIHENQIESLQNILAEKNTN
ncbi:ClC family H(+)/Cl(-) exchange transporter [Pectinatus cerevisiiphilus]|uniref:H+/Cl-antiporter ClcA n=1 Tax=Pectinatus cerevisiiphilus TaxID=86956 RepID=A0A4R3K6S0_9FIRM|nr:ClC family H(+)/Cl(-) exchange transporter [Pectinatus cerevisiiphilus]TCS78391.1 H+/Cl- antiporter ClcA [Pectinatus cerevisiiphilus]